MPSVIKLVYFGNPILRENARKLSANEVKSDTIQQLIADIHCTNETKKYGVGLAAPQVSMSIVYATQEPTVGG
jgi:peptide deformylase